MRRRASIIGALFVAATTLICVPPVAAQHGGGGGGDHGGGAGGGCGDVFGDLIHVKRDTGTGVPILAKRWIELPKEIPGYGWGYCAIAVDADGNELGFLPLTCDIDVNTGTPVEVDYFGRLSAGRTKERNQRMHFNEVIFNIKESQLVDFDEAGRLRMASGCELNPAGKIIVSTCSWSVIDSPMENLALYHRLMKYGHIQTDPSEVDLSAHGDPEAGTQYHPALNREDWGKFRGHLRQSLLPRGSEDECFTPGVGFNPACAENISLTENDFVVAGAFLGGAAGKENIVTVDLVQYLNRILKITKDTTADPSGGTFPNVDTLPAKVRDCWPEGQAEPVPPGEDEIPIEPTYLPVDQCQTEDASGALPNYALFAEATELFVNFEAVTYDRNAWFADRQVPIVRPVDPMDPAPIDYVAVEAFPLMTWVAYANPTMANGANIDGFVFAASDALRAIQFIHNYEIPEVLWNFPAPTIP